MPPWDLEEQPISWRDWALIAQGAEAEAEGERHKLAEAARKRQRFGESARDKRQGFARRAKARRR